MESPGANHRSVETSGQTCSVGGEQGELPFPTSFIHDFPRASRKCGSKDGKGMPGAVEEGT